MKKINPEMFPMIYKLSKEVYNNSISLSSAAKKLGQKYGMNKNSATGYIRSTIHIRNGDLYRRTVNIDFLDYLLTAIQNEFGNKNLSYALNGLLKHIEYLKSKTGSESPGLKDIYNRYSSKISFKNGDEDEIEQTEIAKNLPEDDKENLLQKIKDLEQDTNISVPFNGKRYKRNNVLIVYLKKYRDFACQLCGHKILKKDGSYYIEAAHITPKAYGGEESMQNILILCPNHHKEFDFGERKEYSRSDREFIFILNGKKFQTMFESKSG